MTEDLTIDLAHLEAQAKATGAKVLLLSHMRGHVCDMDALMALCDRLGVRVIEDCAHTMGAQWKGVAVGSAWGDRLLFDADLQAHELWRGRVSGHR